MNRKTFFVMNFLLPSDEYRYGYLVEYLKKGVFRGRDEYPLTGTEAYNLLMRKSK